MVSEFYVVNIMTHSTLQFVFAEPIDNGNIKRKEKLICSILFYIFGYPLPTIRAAISSCTYNVPLSSLKGTDLVDIDNSP